MLFLIYYNKKHPLGSGLTVGQRILVPSGEGSNPSSPAKREAVRAGALARYEVRVAIKPAAVSGRINAPPTVHYALIAAHCFTAPLARPPLSLLWVWRSRWQAGLLRRLSRWVALPCCGQRGCPVARPRGPALRPMGGHCPGLSGKWRRTGGCCPAQT